MAFKTHAPVSVSPSNNETWQEFRIPGLEYIQADEFRMLVNPLTVDWSEIDHQLVSAGIPKDRVDRYIEQIQDIVAIGELAHSLAERMTRIS